MRGQPGHNTRPHFRLKPSFLGMDDLATKRTFDLQPRGVIDVLGPFFGIISLGVCTVRHWWTSDRLVQEFNACIVALLSILILRW